MGVLLFVLFTAHFQSHAQKMMKTIDDAQLLKANEHLFVGKPLQTLLNEIIPEIKIVSVRESWAEAIGAFIFRFIDSNEEKAYNLAGKRPTSLIVKVKEELKWNKKDKPLKERQKWTKEDGIKYGSLTVVYIGVVGENYLTTNRLTNRNDQSCQEKSTQLLAYF